MKDIINTNLTELNGQIADACEEYDRDADEITIIAVTKTHPASVIKTATAAGLFEIGESRIQEAEPKITEVGNIARFHLIGHLQSNKVKKAVQLFDVIQSVDSLKLAQEISKRCQEIERTVECFVEVNSSGEEEKHGISPDNCIELIKAVSKLPNIKLTGLMTMAPHVNDEEIIRTAFALGHKLFKEGQQIIGDDFDNLSMGMSGDFAFAIAEGSTMISVGTGLFGPRRLKRF